MEPRTSPVRTIWNNVRARRAIKGLSVGLAAFGCIYLINDPSRVQHASRPPYVQSSQAKPRGGLTINGIIVDYHHTTTLRLSEYATKDGVYDIRFSRTKEDPIDQLLLKTVSNKDHTRSLFYHEDETQEFVVSGKFRLDTLSVIAGDQKYTMQFR